jgi:hypothetical protein
MNHLQKIVNRAKNMANLLIPYTFPKANIKSEHEIVCLKQEDIVVDGYPITICYSIADYDEYFLKSIQLQSVYSPFLPFTVVCKIGQMFLGKKDLSYIEFFESSKKIYCWTTKSVDEKTLPPDKQTKPGTYEGFNFNIINPGLVDLF